MYKIAFIDLDGTLLNSKKEISDFDQYILKQASKQIKIVFASARGSYRILPYVKQIGTLTEDNYTLGFNGGLLMNNTDTLRLVDNCIDHNNLLKLLQWLFELKLTEVYAYDFNGSVKLQLEQYPDNFIYKVVVLESKDNVSAIRKAMPEFVKNNFEITSSEPERIEFVQKGMTKQQTIQKLLKHLNITKDEMIAIGDGENDIAMLKMAGLSIAMGNASDQVKEIANMITDSNDNSGVGKALEKVLGL